LKEEVPEFLGTECRLGWQVLLAPWRSLEEGSPAASLWTLGSLFLFLSTFKSKRESALLFCLVVNTYSGFGFWLLPQGGIKSPSLDPLPEEARLLGWQDCAEMLVEAGGHGTGQYFCVASGDLDKIVAVV
jgi:hypothetical protein